MHELGTTLIENRTYKRSSDFTSVDGKQTETDMV